MQFNNTQDGIKGNIYIYIYIYLYIYILCKAYKRHGTSKEIQLRLINLFQSSCVEYCLKFLFSFGLSFLNPKSQKLILEIPSLHNKLLSELKAYEVHWIWLTLIDQLIKLLCWSFHYQSWHSITLLDGEFSSNLQLQWKRPIIQKCVTEFWRLLST